MAEKQSKKIRSEQKNKSITARVNIGVAFQRWRELRQLKGLKTDEEVAIFLLESYEKEIYIYTPYTDEKSGQSLPPMSSLGSQCLRDDYNIKEEKELEKSTSSAIEELEVSIDWEDGVSERQDSDTDSADPDYECVSDELIINTDGAYPDSEEVDTTTDDANPEYECVSDELNTDTGVVDPDYDRVSEELNIYTDSEDPDSEGVSEKMENDTDSDDPDYSCTEEPLRTVISRGIGKTIKLPEREHRSFLEQPQERLPESQNQHEGLPRLKKNHNCVICGKVFSNSAGLRRHQVIHTGKRPFNCSICDKGFTQSGNLRTHMKVHIGKVPNWRLLLEKSPPKESPVTVHVCGQCGMEFPQKEQLEEHSQSHKKPYECPDCRKTFKNEDYFELHKRIHSGDLPFLCSECGKGFVTAVLLKQHEYTHTGEKNFHCDHCGRAFSKAFNLKLHLRTHTGERPHLCSVCGKSYSRADILKAHLRVHTGEKPYICEKCGKCFHYHQGYQQHMRSHNKKPKPQTKQLGRPKQQ